MATLTTAGSTYTGAETLDIIVRPQFTGYLPSGMKPIYTDGASSVKLTFFSSAGNALAAYADGFQGGTASTKKQKAFTVGEFKSERAWSKQDYLSIIQRQTEDLKNAFQNDIFKSEFMAKIPFGLLGLDPLVEPTDEQLLSMAEYLVFSMGIAQGIMEVFYLANTDKIVEKAEGTGVFPNNVVSSAYDADIRFNPVDGLWTSLIGNADTDPTVDQVKHVAMSNAAVAQVNTITLAGEEGTATVTVKGLAKVATWDTSIEVTSTAFVAANAAAYLEVGLVLTGTTTLIFTANVAGVAFDDGTGVNATGDLAGGSVATTGNTSAVALASGEAMAAFNSMVTGQPKALKAIPRQRKVILATQSMIENYETTLGVAGASMETSESQRNVLINGVTELKFNGIPIVEMPIDAAIDAYDFGYPHRAILTVPENIAPILSTAGNFAESALWWNKDENENRARVQLSVGGDYWLPELTVVAY